MSKHTYEVTEDGRVFSLTNWRGYGRRELGQTPNADGYPSVRMVINGKRKRVAVHRLVSEKFHGPRPSIGHEVCHIDGDKTNNRASNLRWGTRKDNAADRESHGRTSRGEAHSRAIKASNQADGTRAFRRKQAEVNYA
jgi:hypothetical protein